MNFKTIRKYTIILISAGILLFQGFDTHAQFRREKANNPNLTPEQVNRRTELFLDAQKEKLRENYDRVEELLREVLRIDPLHHPSMYELARIYRLSGRYSEAIKLLERATAIDPANEWYLQFLIEAYIETHQLDKAFEAQEKLIRLFPDKIQYRYDLATMYWFVQEYRKAIEVYDEIEKITGISEDLAVRKKRLYNQMNKPRQALAEIEKLVSSAPENVRYLLILADTYNEMNQEAQAFEVYQKVRKLDPENPYVSISLAELYMKQGKTNQAIQELRSAFASPLLEPDFKVNVFRKFFPDTTQESTLTLLLELSEILYRNHPDNRRVKRLHAEMLGLNKKYAEALALINELIEENPDDYFLWQQKIVLEDSLDDFHEVIKTSKAMIELFPFSPLPHFFAGLAHIQLKNYQAARQVLETGLTLVVDDEELEADFYGLLGDVCNSLKDYKKSDEYYEKALKINPDDALVLNNYSYFLSLRRENLQRAKEMAARANELVPNEPSFQDTYGWVLYQLGDYAEAEVWLRKALMNDNENNPVILEHYGDVLYRLGKSQEALIYWKKAAEKDVNQETSEELNYKIRTGKLPK